MPKFRPPNRGKRAQPVTFSAPTGGLNGRDNIGEMPHTDAFRLENWFPSGTSVDTRGGCLDFATGIAGAVESLETYTGAAGSKMLAFGDGKIFDVSLGGAVGDPLAEDRVSNKINSCMFSNAGSQFLLIFSGLDVPLSFDGTTLDELEITGLNSGHSSEELHTAMPFKGRVFLAGANELGFYYLGIGAIQGAASYFDLQQQSVKGGYLQAIVSFSEDSGAGLQDYAAFITSEGEYIVYQGTDPSNAATWQIVARYYGPPPIGRKGWFKYRSDVYFITEEGILSLSQIRQTGEDNEYEKYITAKLGRIYTDAVRYQETHGWGGMIYPGLSALIVNIPSTSAQNGPYTQFLMNTNTNAWCTFTGWNGLCWTLFGRRVYFGTFDGKVVLADEGFTDNGTSVRAVCRQAWNTFDDGNGMGEADKQFHFATVALQADGVPSISCALNVNYEDDQPATATALGEGSGAEWDVAEWDVAEWAGSTATQNLTVPIGKIGYTASLWLQATSVAAKIRFFATRFVLEKTRGVLLQ